MVFYLLVDSKDYMSSRDDKPEAYFYDTKEEVLVDLFGSKRDFTNICDEEDEIFQEIKDMSETEYFQYRMDNYCNGDGESMKSIFEINTKTKETKLIV